MKRQILNLGAALLLAMPTAVAQQDTVNIRLDSRVVTIIKDQEAGKLEIDFSDFADEMAQVEIQAEMLKLEEELAQLESEMETLEAEQRAAREAEREAMRQALEALRQSQESLGRARVEGSSDEPECEDNDRFEPHWSGLDLGLNNYFTPDYSMRMEGQNQFMELDPGRSVAVNLNLLEASFGIVPNRLGILTGLGFEFNNYRFENNSYLVENEDGQIVGITDPGIRLTKSTLNTTYLTAPLMFEFQAQRADGKEPFYLAVGALGGVRLGAKTKQFYEADGREFEDKIKGHYQLHPWRYGLTARVGFGKVRLFANYYISSLFQDGAGPELYPVSFGITLLDF